MLNLNPTWLACEARTAACSEVKLRKVPVLSCNSIMWLEGTKKQNIKISGFKKGWLEPGLWIRIRMDPHSFSILDPDLDPGG